MKYRDLRPVPWIQDNCFTRIETPREFHVLLISVVLIGFGVIGMVSVFMFLWESLWWPWLLIALYVMIPLYGFFLFRICVPVSRVGSKRAEQLQVFVRAIQGIVLGFTVGLQWTVGHMESSVPSDGSLDIRVFLWGISLTTLSALLLFLPCMFYVEKFILKRPDTMCIPASDM